MVPGMRFQRETSRRWDLWFSVTFCIAVLDMWYSQTKTLSKRALNLMVGFENPGKQETISIFASAQDLWQMLLYECPWKNFITLAFSYWHIQMNRFCSRAINRITHNKIEFRDCQVPRFHLKFVSSILSVTTFIFNTVWFHRIRIEKINFTAFFSWKETQVSFETKSYFLSFQKEKYCLKYYVIRQSPHTAVVLVTLNRTLY